MRRNRPLAKLYAPRLSDLAAEHRYRGVHFVAIDAIRHDSVDEVARFGEDDRIDFPILKDPEQIAADRLGAERTPEVFVLDKTRRLCFHGRVDDQYGIRVGEGGKRVSYQLPEPRRRDLALALDEILQRKDVTTPLTEVVGCKIGRKKNSDENAEVTYSHQIARLFNQHCVYCHREGQIGPFALTSYEEAAGRRPET